MAKSIYISALLIQFIFSGIIYAQLPEYNLLLDSTVYYYNNSEFEKSISFGKSALESIDNELGEYSKPYSEVLFILSNTYYKLNNLDSAEYYCEIELEINREIYPEGSDKLSVSMGNLGYYYLESRRFSEAKPLFEEAIESLRKLYPGGHKEIAANLSHLGTYYFMQSELDSAEKYYVESVEMSRMLITMDSTDLASYLNNLANFYNDTGKFDEAEKLYLEALGIFRKAYESDNSDMAVLIGNIGYFYQKQGRFEEAEPLLREVLEITHRLHKSDHSEKASALLNLGIMYYNMGLFENAEPYYKESLEMYRRIIKGDDLTLALAIENSGVFMISTGNNSEAEKLFLESFEMKKRITGDLLHPSLFNTYNNLSYLYDITGRDKDAEEYYLLGMVITINTYKKDHPKYAMMFNNIALFYDDRGLLNRAGEFYKEALALRRNIYKGNHPELAVSINNMAAYYNSIGLFEKAELLYNESLDINKQLYGEEHPALITSYLNLGGLYENKGEYEKAEEFYLSSLEMSKKLFPGDDLNTSKILNSIGDLYISLGRKSDAEQYLTQSIEMLDRLSDADLNIKIVSIFNLAIFYNDNKDIEKAGQYFERAMEMCKRLYKKDHPTLATVLEGYAQYFHDIKNFDKAKKLYFEALEMRRRIYVGDHPDIAQSLNNIAYIYGEMGDINKADSLFNRALIMVNRIFEPGHIRIAALHMNIALLNFKAENFPRSEEHFIKSIDMYRGIIRDNFQYMSEKEKGQFLATVENNFEAFNSIAVLREKSSPLLLKYMFENRLLLKGILINSSRKVKDRILNSGDSTTIDMYNNFLTARETLSRAYSEPSLNNTWKRAKIDSLEFLSNTLEKELSKRSRDFDVEFEKNQYTYEDIRSTLSDVEAAVEMIRFRKFEKDWTDTIIYAALIAVRNSEIPRLVVFEDGNNMENKYLEAYYNTVLDSAVVLGASLYDKYWGAIADELNGINKVYFSADGVYFRININTLKNLTTNKFLIEELDLRLVTSSRDLLELKEKDSVIAGKTAMLFGDIKYRLTDKDFIGRDSTFTISEKEEGLDDSKTAKIKQLPETKTEINNIKQILTDNKYITSEFTSSDADESELKNAKSPGIVHIATHGKFFNDLESTEGSDIIMGFEAKSFRENPLLRSFLLFAGAENTITNNAHGKRAEDGLLTAYEAMNLDLNSTDLVVLSACETGLGEIIDGEGVYGLQRSFIKAGAKNLIMSLWSVSDLHTRILMTRFYKKWLSGIPIHQAFRETQIELLKINPIPKYWGAFVIVGE